jgi:NAD(P)-dependent dehydrogenase (short-subunit alcohol dehydrogenase family)
MNTPVVLITGALTGIGRAIALAFAKEGARIVIAGRRDEAVSRSSTLRGALTPLERNDLRLKKSNGSALI